jgi:transposase-like protein
MITIKKRDNENRKLWRQIIAEAEVFQGTRKEFCQLHTINEKSFYYYRRQFQLEGLMSKQRAKSAFVKAVVEQTPIKLRHSLKSAIPDPKWAAEVMIHLWRMSS